MIVYNHPSYSKSGEISSRLSPTVNHMQVAFNQKLDYSFKKKKKNQKQKQKQKQTN